MVSLARMMLVVALINISFYNQNELVYLLNYVCSEILMFSYASSFLGLLGFREL